MPQDGALADVTGLSPSVGWAAGALVSTVDDVAAFYRALLRGRLLPPRMLAEMRTTNPMPIAGDRYGLGLWRTALIKCGVAWGHNGDLPGYHADAFLHGNRQVVLLSNVSGDDYSRRTHLAAFRVLNAALCR
jgi:D-alanyl-D-alanine carboxypeptidase